MSDAGALDERELAERAGVDVETIRRYTQLGLRAHDDGTYTAGDLARVRLLGSCERGGLPLDGISAKAGPSEVLVTDQVRRVASPELVRFEEIGAAELKGFANPVPLLRAGWA
jgi:MerR HTH family regulatory protein